MQKVANLIRSRFNVPFFLITQQQVPGIQDRLQMLFAFGLCDKFFHTKIRTSFENGYVSLVVNVKKFREVGPIDGARQNDHVQTIAN